MRQAPSFQLGSFEQLAVNGEFVLLRAAGGAGAAGLVGVAALLVDDGRERHRVAPLPDPGDDGDQVRAGFSLAARLVDGSSFALELADGAIVELPEPSRRAASGTDIGRLARALAATELRAVEGAARRRELEAALAAMTDRAERTETAAAEERVRADRLGRALDATRALAREQVSLADAETARALVALRAAELRVTAERDRVEALEARLAEATSAIARGHIEDPDARPPRASPSEPRPEMTVEGVRETVTLATTTPARDSSKANSNGDQALDVARAITINMALAGRPREEAEALLRDDLALPDPLAVLDECYGPERWPTPARGRRPALRRRPRP